MKRGIPYHLHRVPTRTGPCAVCGKTFTGHYAKRICDPCKPAAYKACSKANALIQRALRRGDLPHPWAAGLICVYCGGRARLWEHRDYSKPLDVVPACGGCNVKVGPGRR